MANNQESEEGKVNITKLQTNFSVHRREELTLERIDSSRIVEIVKHQIQIQAQTPIKKEEVVNKDKDKDEIAVAETAFLSFGQKAHVSQYRTAPEEGLCAVAARWLGEVDSTHRGKSIAAVTSNDFKNLSKHLR